MTFSEKVKAAREMLEITQTDLAEKVGVSRRAIVAYETNNTIPRRKTLEKLASALKVSIKFLSDENCNDPLEGIEQNSYLQQARALYGNSGVRDLEYILKDNVALFAGGEISNEQKDAFYDAVFKAYCVCREAAREKYGRKK